MPVDPEALQLMGAGRGRPGHPQQSPTEGVNPGAGRGTLPRKGPGKLHGAPELCVLSPGTWDRGLMWGRGGPSSGSRGPGRGGDTGSRQLCDHGAEVGVTWTPWEPAEAGGASLSPWRDRHPGCGLPACRLRGGPLRL